MPFTGQSFRTSLTTVRTHLVHSFRWLRWNGLRDDEWDIRSNVSIGNDGIEHEKHYGLEYSSWHKISTTHFGCLSESVNPPVFLMSSLAVLIFLACVLTAKPQLQRAMPSVMNFVALNFGWFYVALTCALVVALAYLAMSKYGDIKLGDQNPEYPAITWISLMFSAGVGVALVYYGTSQPLDYYRSPPIEGTIERIAYEQAVPLALFVQGYLSWPCFSLMGLTLAYLHNNVGLPVSIRSVAAPLLGKYTHRWPGHIIDIIAIVGTVFGIAATLGVGTTQLMSGVNHSIPTIPNTIGSQIVLLLIVGILAGTSVLFGISRGMATMANINMLLAFLWLMTFFFINLDPVASSGQWYPISHIMAMIQNIGVYGHVVFERAFRTAVDTPTEMEWMAKWCYFFSGWQLTWSPFVSSFLAAISKGRTIRSYILATIVVPHLVNLVWFTIMGRVGIIVSQQWEASRATKLTDEPIALQIYKIVEFLTENGRIWESTQWFMNGMIVIVLVIFIVTSADSATYVIVTINAGGNPRRAKAWLKLYWLSSVLLVCGLMLWLGGVDLFDSLEAILIAMGLPLGVLMIISLASLVKLLTLSDEERQCCEAGLASECHSPMLLSNDCQLPNIITDVPSNNGLPSSRSTSDLEDPRF